MNLETIKKEKGDMLLEALISMLLMAIVAMGVTFTLTKVAVNSRDTKEHILVVNDLRQMLLTRTRDDLCNNTHKIQISGVEETIEAKNCNKKIKIMKDNAEVKLDGNNVEMQAPIVLTIVDKVNGVDVVRYSVGGKDLE